MKGSSFQCYVSDGGRPSGIAVHAEVSNRHKVLWSKAMVLNVMEKGSKTGSGKDDEDERK